MLQRFPRRKVCGHVPVTDADVAAPRPGNHSVVSGEELRTLHGQGILVRRAQGTVDQTSGQFGGRHVEDAPAKDHAHVQLRQNQEHVGTVTRLRGAASRVHGRECP